MAVSVAPVLWWVELVVVDEVAKSGGTRLLVLYHLSCTQDTWSLEAFILPSCFLKSAEVRNITRTCWDLF